jgi:glutathione synthase/RimK-type ligase-like ATP-grasp enzyme
MLSTFSRMIRGCRFAELDRRGTRYVRVDARRHHFDVAARERPYSLLFNRMSPSAYLRGESHGIYHTLAYLDHLERLGTRVVNGSRGFRVETSKALQLSLLASLGLRYPAARVVNHPGEVPRAAQGLRFPVVVKANVGGSGAGIVRLPRSSPTSSGSSPRQKSTSAAPST